MTAGELGLTLIETLVVLAIVAVAAGATTLSLAPRRGDAAEAEAHRLATTIQAAADGALVTGAPARLEVAADGYGVAGGPRHAVPAGIRLAAPAVLPLDLAEAHPFAVVVAAPASRWAVTFDGVRASAAPRPAP